MRFKNKKILITGADGFIGSHLVERLVKEGARVKAFVYYNSFNSWGWLDTLPPAVLKQIEIFSGDVRDPHGVLAACRGCEIVFHLAALIGIPFSYHAPDTYVDTNVKGTLNILQAAQALKIKRVIHTSTSEVYGTARYAPIDELHPINPQSPYAATKSAADSLALSFYRSFNTPVVVARPFNTFGPRQSARAIIPTILSQIHSGTRAIQLGNLSATRDFNYVSNTVDAFLAIALMKGGLGEVYNIGSGQEISIQQLVESIRKIIKKDFKVVVDQKRLRPGKSEVERLICDATKIHQACGWTPQVNFEEGLSLMSTWVKAHIKQYKSGIYNV